ncbi:fused PTS fructose transporter subunit IIA/HPr protein [Xenorhabdus bharatensis]|uniref:fused PTS fructose transporter subunit IIA/HPr protein n=1 Tax=Xenorhabdus bharatensis TaxID=3136256 RepID=UPI0030F40537
MFHLTLRNIHLAAHADNKENAIQQVADALTTAGYASKEYIDGMLERETQSSTYLGNGIAIPHGTYATRGNVLHTGVQVMQFPDGVDWGDNQTAYIIIGIAAKSDEHLKLLHQLLPILNDENRASQMAKTTSADELYHLLMNPQPPYLLDASTITLDIDTRDLTTLQALNLARLQKTSSVNAAFIADILARSPIHLGQGIWLSDSSRGSLRNAVAIARPKYSFNMSTDNLDEKPISLLITIAYADDQLHHLLTNLNTLIQQGKGAQLQQAQDNAKLIRLLTTKASQQATSQAKNTLTADFILPNEHGLHTRPSALLVHTIKQFSSRITITPLDGDTIPVDGRKLMLVAGLGIKRGDRIRFTASGPDAKEALEAIKNLINNNLGEDIA